MNYRRALVTLFIGFSLFWNGQVWGAVGDPLWEQTFDYLPNYDTTGPNACAASSGTLIVCGMATKQTQLTEPPYTSSMISLGFIRAYDVATGALKWQGAPLTLASTPDVFNYNYFGNIIISGNIAMIQGWSLSNSNTYPATVYLSKTILRAYNITTGQLLWENIKDGACTTPGNSIYATSGRVFIIGVDNAAGNTPCGGWLRAYQIPGTVLQTPLLLSE